LERQAVAGDERISNTAHAQLLPPSWATLYEISRLDDETFAAKIEDGNTPALPAGTECP
jgi:hypothetical protein